MAMSRKDHVSLKIDELENLKRAMHDFNGERLSKVRRGAEEPSEEGDHEGVDASLDVSPSRGMEHEPDFETSSQDGGGAEGGDATDLEGQEDESAEPEHMHGEGEGEHEHEGEGEHGPMHGSMHGEDPREMDRDRLAEVARKHRVRR